MTEDAQETPKEEKDTLIHHDCQNFEQWWESCGPADLDPREIAEIAWEAARHMESSQAGYVGPPLKPANLDMPDDPIKIGSRRGGSRSGRWGWNYSSYDDRPYTDRHYTSRGTRSVLEDRERDNQVVAHKPEPEKVNVRTNVKPVYNDSVSDRFVEWIQECHGAVFFVVGFVALIGLYVLLYLVAADNNIRG